MKKTNWIVLLAIVMVLCFAFAACTIEKADNSITGLKDATATCGDNVPKLNATAAYGEVTYGLAKAVEGKAKESLTYGEYKGTLTVGTYYVKASVAEADDYKAAEAYATIIVAHQAFDAIEGNGEVKHETTTDGKYRVWTEKKCACGETIIGNETITDKLPATIGGVADITDNCGYVVATSGITTDKGTLKFELATAVEGTDKEKLTYAELTTQPLNVGTYYLKVSVAEGEDFGAATAYAKITINHKAYDEIDGEGTFVAPVFDTKTKGYYTKTCACGTEIHKGEYVSVRVTVDGTALADQVVEVGKNLVVPTDLPQREGYKMTLKNGAEVFDFTSVQVNDFATYNLTAEYIATETRTGNISVGAGSAWMLIKGDDTKLTDENVSSVEQKDGYVEVKTNFLPDNATACMQLSLGAGALDAYHTYTFTFKASQGTFVWFGSNFETGKFVYTDEMATANTVVAVVLTNVDGNLMASFNGGAAFNCGKAADLNEQTLCFQDKDETQFANRGKRYTIIVTEVVSAYDYLAEAQAVLANIPTDAEDVTVENAFQLDEAIALFDTIATHFSATEAKTYIVDKDIRAKVTALVSDHINIANYIIKDLPAFDIDALADMTADEQTALYNLVTKYVAYVKTAFTADELAKYTESKDIAMYRYYFAGRKEVVKNVIADGKTDIVAPDFKTESSGIRVTSAGKHDITLPAIPLAAYTEVYMYISIRCSSVVTATIGENSSYVLDGTNGTWAKLRFFIKDGKWLATISHPEKQNEATATEVAQDVVSGNKGFTFTVEVTSGDNYNILIDFPNNNTIYGTQIATDTTVYKVDYTYQTAAGEKQATMYYLGDEKLVLPEIATTYEDEIGTHTFKGWFAGETQHNADEIVSGDLTLVAKFEVTRYNEFTVTYYQDDNVTKYGEEQTYHYGDKLVLPAEPTKTSQGTTQYAFVGWYDADGKQYKGGEIITDNLELTAKFNAMTVKVTITLTNLDGDDEVINDYYAGARFEKPVDPSREGFVFAGWYTTDGELYDFDTLLGNDGLTLVAKWLMESSKAQVVAPDVWVDSKSGFGGQNVNTGKSRLYDSKKVTFANWLTLSNGSANSTITLKPTNYNLYSVVEFDISNDGGLGDVVINGQTLALSSTTEKNHFLFVISGTTLNVYGITDGWKAVLATADLSELTDVLNGVDGLTITFVKAGTIHVSEMHGTTKYIDAVAEAKAINTEFAAWCNTNVGAVSELTAEKKGTFANYLNKLYIARSGLTAKEAAENKIEGIITFVQQELAKLDDSYFDVFAATDFTYNELYRDASRDVKGQAVKNGAYEAPNAATTMDYYGYGAGGTDSTGGTFTLPKINFEALGMTFSLNCAYQNSGVTAKIKVNDVDGSLNKLSNNLEYCPVIGIYKDATSGKWFVRQYSGSGDYDYKVQLTDAQANGQEAVTFTISLESASWFSFHISNLSATF